jgi:predicted ATPase
MITSITLQNYKSFGREVTVPLEPITVLVGPNNSGKSAFMSIGRVVHNILVADGIQALRAEGVDSVFHRPAVGDGNLVIGWTASVGDEKASYRGECSRANPGNIAEEERLEISGKTWRRNRQTNAMESQPGSERLAHLGGGPFAGLQAGASGTFGDFDSFWALAASRFVRVSVDAAREDAPVVENPTLESDGAGLAAVLGSWRGEEPAKAEELDKFLQDCVPEIEQPLVRSMPGKQRLIFVQKDGEKFDAAHASDGLVAFTALAAAIISATPNSLFFIEEPEGFIHPRRLRKVMDLLRHAVKARGCQFVLATHSTVPLNEMKDSPERIVLFRRGPEGTEAKRCTDIPAVKEALETSTPGEMLETAFFEGLWGDGANP